MNEKKVAIPAPGTYITVYQKIEERIAINEKATAYAGRMTGKRHYCTMTKKESDKGAPVRLPELLAPAGNYEKLVTAVHYGADAVYLGGEKYSLRAKAGNFDEEWLRQGVVHAHDNGVKVYVTVNIFAHNQDFDGLTEYLRFLAKVGVDGLIIADPGILTVARNTVPALAVHLSTQANVTNRYSAAFWVSQGASRLNLARELSFAEVEEIRKTTSCELEIFVHGALCISYSGRCMLSNYMTGRDANHGNCAHPCRFSYQLVEEKRPDQYFPVEEDERGTYIFNSKDLCLMAQLPRLIALGVDSLKIEGRMKSIFYVGGVVRAYRAALDYLQSLPAEAWREPEKIALPELFYKEIGKTGTRGATENFFNEKPGSTEMNYLTSRSVQTHEPVTVIREEGAIPLVEIRNQLRVGEVIEYMHRSMELTRVTILEIKTEDGDVLQHANPGNRVFLTTDPLLTFGRRNGIARREKRATGE